MRSTLAVTLALGLACPVAGRADVVVLDDGARVEGAVVGEEKGALVVMTATGERRLEPARVARLEAAPTSPSLLRKAERVRARWADERRREAERLVRRWRRADPAERAGLEAALEALGPEAQARPLEGALDDASPEVRDFALTRLAALGPVGVDPLLRCALVARDPALRDRAHAAALAVDAERTRRVYEQVAGMVEAAPLRRVRAIQRLEALGQRAAVPALVAVLEWVQLELRVQQARAGEMRRVPVNLGTTSGAGVSVPVELPELQLVEIGTTVTVPTLRILGAAAARALGTLSGGQALGEDPAAWRRWWDAQPPGLR